MPLQDRPSGYRQRTAIQEMLAEPSRHGLCVSMCYEENFSSLSHSFSVISVSFPLANYLIVFILELYNTFNQNAIPFLKFLYIFSTFSASFRCELCQYCINCRFCIQKKSSFSKRFPNSFRFSKQTSLFSQRFSFIFSNYSFSLRRRTDAPGITAPAFTINSTSALFGRSI